MKDHQASYGDHHAFIVQRDGPSAKFRNVEEAKRVAIAQGDCDEAGAHLPAIAVIALATGAMLMYTGAAVSGVPHGRGQAVDSATRATVYIGEWRNGAMTGSGMRYVGNDTFAGTFLDGKLQGEGKWIGRGFELTGWFRQGRPHGRCTNKTSRGVEFSGTYAHGFRVGSGREVEQLGAGVTEVATGTWAADRRQGKFTTTRVFSAGVEPKPDTVVSITAWFVDDVHDGPYEITFGDGMRAIRRYKSGTLVDPDDQAELIAPRNAWRYRGGVSRDNRKREGRGELRNTTGALEFVGDWSDDKPLRVVNYALPTGTYTGGFRDGAPHGAGTLAVRGTNMVYHGSWDHGVLCGTYRIEFSPCTGVEREFEGEAVAASTAVVPQRASQGTIYYTRGAVYQGDVVWGSTSHRPAPHGQGAWSNARGEVVYQGSWGEGRYHGSGTLYHVPGSADGVSVTRGEFLNGKPHGSVERVFVDGTGWKGRMDMGIERDGVYTATDGQPFVDRNAWLVHRFDQKNILETALRGNKDRTARVLTNDDVPALQKESDDRASVQRGVTIAQWSLEQAQRDVNFACRKGQLILLQVSLDNDILGGGREADFRRIDVTCETDLILISPATVAVSTADLAVTFVLDGDQLPKRTTKNDRHLVKVKAGRCQSTCFIELGAALPKKLLTPASAASAASTVAPVVSREVAAASVDIYGAPVHLVEIDEQSHNFVFNEAARHAIANIDDKLKVLVVAGTARDGKSYLMNLFADVKQGDPGGFATGATYDPCTKGLFCWARKRQDYTLLLIDTEGTGDPERMKVRPDFDQHMVALSVLLSSIFIFNTKIQSPAIAGTAIDNLSASLLKAAESKIPVDPAARGTLIWLIRDDANYPKDDEALRSAFDRKGQTQFVDAYFRSMVMRGLPMPCPADRIANVQLLPDSEIHAHFRAAFERLYNEVEAATAVKTIGATPISGEQLAILIETYLRWTSASRTTKPFFEQMCESSRAQALLAATEQLQRELEASSVAPRRRPLSRSEAEEIANAAVLNAQRKYEATCIGEPSPVELQQFHARVQLAAPAFVSDQRFKWRCYSAALCSDFVKSIDVTEDEASRNAAWAAFKQQQLPADADPDVVRQYDTIVDQLRMNDAAHDREARQRAAHNHALTESKQAQRAEEALRAEAQERSLREAARLERDRMERAAAAAAAEQTRRATEEQAAAEKQQADARTNAGLAMEAEKATMSRSLAALQATLSGEAAAHQAAVSNLKRHIDNAEADAAALLAAATRRQGEARAL
jgi:flagellar biosynthesis GTPase FlhF